METTWANASLRRIYLRAQIFPWLALFWVLLGMSLLGLAVWAVSAAEYGLAVLNAFFGIYCLYKALCDFTGRWTSL